LTRSPALAAFAVAVAAGGCGGGGDETPATTTPPPPPPPRETVDHLPKLPESWHKHVDERGGFALGLPRGWKANRTGDGLLVRSFDHLVAISIAPDRRRAALEEPLDEFAKATAKAVGGFRGELTQRSVRRFPHRYSGAEVRARGTARGGVTQRVSVVVLRRDRVAMVTAVIASNVKRSADESLRLARRVVGTLRTRPPAGLAG
jgi:hypothetical protein